MHGPLDAREAAALRRRFGHTRLLYRRGNVIAWGRTGSRRPLILPAYAEIAEHVLIDYLEDLGITASEYYEAVRDIRGV